MDAQSLKSAAAQQQTKNAVVTQEKKALAPAERIKGLLISKLADIKNALPKGWDEKRFIRIALTAVSSNPKLCQACVYSPTTFVGAMMNAAQLGLEPNTSLGKAYLLPYNNIDKNTGKKVPQVQFQIGVYGYIDLAFRSGLVKSIDADVRRQKDFWQYEKGDNDILRHIPYDEGDPGEAIGYYAIVKMKDGAVHKSYMSKFQVLTHAKRFSKSYNKKTGTFSGPWETDFDAMAKKTVLLQALKFVPKATEDANFANAFNLDNTVRNGLSTDMEKTEGIFAESAVRTVSEIEPGASVVDAEVVEHEDEEE